MFREVGLDDIFKRYAENIDKPLLIAEAEPKTNVLYS